MKEIATSNIMSVKHFDGPSAMWRSAIARGAGAFYAFTHPLTGDS